MIEYILLSILTFGGLSYCYVLFSCCRNKYIEKKADSDMCEVLIAQ